MGKRSSKSSKGKKLAKGHCLKNDDIIDDEYKII